MDVIRVLPLLIELGELGLIDSLVCIQEIDRKKLVAIAKVEEVITTCREKLFSDFQRALLSDIEAFSRVVLQ
jgi:hypothetical protein